MIFPVLFTVLSMFGMHGTTHAASAILVQNLPKEMKYFSESLRHTVSDPTEVLLNNLKDKTQFGLHKAPPDSTGNLDALLTNQDFSKAILISYNRRVNPEHLQKFYRHREGLLFQTKKSGQQIALFFYNFTEKELSEIASSFFAKNRNLWRELAIPEAIAASATTSEVATPKVDSVVIPVSKSKTQSASKYDEIIKSSFAGCVYGGAEGLNNIAKTPLSIVWNSALAAKSWNDDPDAFWQRSIDDFKKVGQLFEKFEKYLLETSNENIVSNSKQKIAGTLTAFWKKSPSEKNRTWCRFFSSAAAGGVVAKIAMQKTSASVSPAPIPREISAKKSSAQPVAPVSAGKNTQAQQALAKIELSKGQKWEVIDPTNKKDLEEVFSLYQKTYGDLGMVINNAEKLGASRITAVVRDENNQIISFILGRQDEFGFLVTQIGTNSTRQGLQTLGQTFKSQIPDGMYFQVSGQPLMAIRKSGKASVVSYEQAERIHLAQNKPIRRPTPTELDDAVKNGHIPNDPEVIKNTFSMTVNIDGQVKNLVKVMLGSPIAN